MRKKVLIDQNLSLFEQLETLRADVAVKDKRIKELEDTVSELKAREMKETNDKPQTTLPFKRLEEKVTNNLRLKPDFEYASDVIGKLVLDSASKSNSLTADGNTQNRELVNLLLGKTEVAKAEILSVVSEEGELAYKKEKIDNIADEALDYFSSIAAQIN